MIQDSDRGFLLGDGVFETMRVEDGCPLLLRRHLARLERSFEMIGLDADLSLIEQLVVDEARSASRGPASLRLTVSRGPGPRGLLPPALAEPTMVVKASPARARQSAPVKAIVSAVRRNEGSPVSRIKSLSYQDEVLARMEAQAAGAEDAIMLNNQGAPASTSMANLYALVEGRWLTPPIETGVLPGIVREVLVEAGAIEEAEISAPQLIGCPLARSNSLVGIEPLLLERGAAPDYDAIKRLTDVLAAAETKER